MSSDARVSAGAPEARLTPYELAFGHEGFEEVRFRRILAEAEARGADTSVPERFLMLEEASSLVRELAPDAAGVDVYGRYGALVHQAWQFWRYGRRLLVLDAELARQLVERFPEVGAWELTPPFPAGYVQLPRHLFWARVEEDAPPEPVDGFFWSMVGLDDPESPPYGRLDLVLVLGVRPGRPGFSMIPLAVELPGMPLGHWADADARPEGKDFDNFVPGGEMQGWYGLVTELEVLKLVSRIFWYVVLNPHALGEPVVAEPAGPVYAAHALPPSALPFQPIRRVGDG